MGLKIDKKVSKQSIKAPPWFGKYTQYKDEYKKLLLDHREWMRKADHLREAANLFREKIKDTWTDWTSGRKSEVSDHFISIYFMLTSYALENLFKALIVLRRRSDLERELRKNPNKLPDQIRGHDLYAFARKCKFSRLDAGDEEFLGGKGDILSSSCQEKKLVL